MVSMRALPIAVIALAGLGCGDEAARTAYLRTPAAGASKYADWSPSGPVPRLSPRVCESEALTPEFGPLTEDDLVGFLEKHGYKSRIIRARRDLVYVDVPISNEDFVRLRIALLPSSGAAGRELHDAVLQHGPGSWGVHRSNLAVLAPIGSLSQIVTFASESKLACWGVLTVAGLDDTLVIPGGYMEL